MNAQPESAHRPVHFGVFELDPASGELRKHGVRIRLQEQPLKLLFCLLETPGEIRTRAELIRSIWPEGTFVDFERGLNVAVTRLRQVLGDSADHPLYVETVGRRGYRFVAPIDGMPKHATPAADAPGIAIPPLERPLTATSSRLWPAVGLAAIILAVAAAAGWWRATRPSLHPLLRLNIELGSELAPSNPGTSVALSPDGTRLAACVRDADGKVRLATRRLDESQFTPLPGTEKATSPFFSPDGQWVAFVAEGKLKKVSVQNSRVIILCNAPLISGGSWGDNGNIIAGFDFALLSVSSAGGTLTPVTRLAPRVIIHRWPQILPGSRAVLFSAYTSLTGLEGASIEVMTLKDHRPKVLVRGGTWGRYLPSGHLIYIDKGTLFAVPFDVDRLELRGTPMPVLEAVAYSTATGSADLDFSRTGALLYQTSRTGGGLVTVQSSDTSGKTRPLLAVPGNYLSPTVSPDGNALALTSAGDMWVYELSDTMRRLTYGGGYGNPVWSADGRYIVFRSGRGMFWTRADGAGSPQPLTQSRNQQVPWSVTPDGKRMAFVEVSPETGADIWTVPVESDGRGLRAGKPEVFLQTAFEERSPMISPDGRWLAYFSNESGTYQAYVRAFANKVGKWKISEDGAAYPVWSRNGRDLFFVHFGLNQEAQLMVVPYNVQRDSFLAEKPRLWAKETLLNFTSTRSYDLAPDGQHIVALVSADGPAEQKRRDNLIFLLNFFDELRRRAPLDGHFSY